MHVAPSLLVAAACLALSRPESRTPHSAPAWIRCTSETIEVEGEVQGKAQGKGQRPAKNPIAEALSKAKPGDTIRLDPGDYPPFTIGFQSSSPANAVTSGGVAGNPIVVEGVGPGVRVVGAEGDTIAIDQRVPNAWITFRNLEIVPGQRAGVMFYQRKDGRTHVGYTFEDCHILGNYDHKTGQGKRTKWGVWGHMLSDFRFAGVRAPARIENISQEHAFYLQNPQGPITIENVAARALGRTFCQFTARASDGPPGIGDVTVRDCVVEDACIAKEDGYKGGSAFTICGRLQGTLLFENNVYRAGFDKELRHLALPGHAYGTGAFTAWEADRGGLNGTLVLRDNQFSFAPGCGDRPVVSIGGCRRVLIVGENSFQSGGAQPTLAFDPVNQQGRPVSSPNGSIYLAPATKVTGELTSRGQPPGEELLAKWRRQGEAEPAAPADPPDAGSGSGGDR